MLSYWRQRYIKLNVEYLNLINLKKKKKTRIVFNIFKIIIVKSVLCKFGSVPITVYHFESCNCMYFVPKRENLNFFFKYFVHFCLKFTIQSLPILETSLKS